MAKPAKKKNPKKHVLKLTRVGGKSYTVVVPHTVVRRFGWQRHQKLTMVVDTRAKKLTIRDWKK